jgi:hypothetical protein
LYMWMVRDVVILNLEVRLQKTMLIERDSRYG